MTTVPLTELHNSLSTLARRVIRGETFEVTQHGEPIFRITPIPDSTGANAGTPGGVARGKGRNARRSTTG